MTGMLEPYPSRNVARSQIPDPRTHPDSQVVAPDRTLDEQVLR